MSDPSATEPAAVRSSARAGERQGPLLAMFLLGHLANDWSTAAVWIIAPAIAVAMGLSPAEVGLLFAIAGAGSALAFLPAGILADRVSNRGRLLLATFWWVAIGYMIASLAPGFWSLAFLLALANAGDAAWHPVATGVLVERMPRRRAQALGIHAVGGTLAEVLAPLAAGFALTYVDWRVALQLAAVPALLMGIVFIRFAASVPPSGREAISRADFKALWRVWRGRAGLGMIVMMAAYNMALMATLSMSALFLQQVHGLSLAAAGMVFAAMSLAGAVTQPVLGRISDAIGRRPLFIAGNGIGALAALVVVLDPGLAVTLAALVVAAGALVGVRSCVLAAAVEFSLRREATTLGFTFALMDGVGAAGALVAGAVGNLDLHYAFLVAAVLSAAAGAMALVAPFGAAEGTGEVRGAD